jgi:hypothetical protein
MAVRKVRLPHEHSEASNWSIIGVVSSSREKPKTKTLSDGGGVVLLVGGSAFVCANGRCCPIGVRRELLRGGLLQRAGASPPQAAANSVAGFSADGLRARYERYDPLFDVLLQGPGAPSADTGCVCAASSKFCSGGG